MSHWWLQEEYHKMPDFDIKYNKKNTNASFEYDKEIDGFLYEPTEEEKRKCRRGISCEYGICDDCVMKYSN